MVVKKRNKHARSLGSNTYGWGKNQHRGAGSRGGRGNAGTGKKAHAQETRVWGTKYFGKSGFTPRPKHHENAIALKDVEQNLRRWVHEKKATDSEVNLSSLGYTKLLSNGKLTKKLKITVAKATNAAAEKIKNSGGELVLQ